MIPIRDQILQKLSDKNGKKAACPDQIFITIFGIFFNVVSRVYSQFFFNIFEYKTVTQNMKNHSTFEWNTDTSTAWFSHHCFTQIVLIHNQVNTNLVKTKFG